MKIVSVSTRTLHAARTCEIQVEVCITRGMPGFNIVGLAETAIKESKDRVRNAILNSHYEFPLKRITVNLAPAHLPKLGSHFDLAIAVGILLASDQLNAPDVQRYDLVGELALSGTLRAVKGIMPIALDSMRCDQQLLYPAQNVAEVSLLKSEQGYAASSLIEVCQHLAGSRPLVSTPAHGATPTVIPAAVAGLPISRVKGQHSAKRALEISATGLHSILFCGPPGTGKSMLARCLPPLLPAMSFEQAVETATVHSMSYKGFDRQEWQQRPFRAPHHSASPVAIVGGGTVPRPGEISLAHHGVLFLDEIAEFKRPVLEALREPLETGLITLARAGRHAEFPSRFLLVATMNPCPCGYAGDATSQCRCTQEQVQRYSNRLSGPIRDRIDIQVQVPRLPTSEILKPDNDEEEASRSHAALRDRINHAYQQQLERQDCSNSELKGDQIETICKLSRADHEFLCKTLDQLQMSARSFHNILRLARTIADLAKSHSLRREHLQEAINLRRLAGQ